MNSTPFWYRAVRFWAPWRTSTMVPTIASVTNTVRIDATVSVMLRVRFALVSRTT